MKSPLKKLAIDLFNKGMKEASKLAGAEDAKRCVWAQQDYDSNDWASACGANWEFFDGGPNENSMNFCPACGYKVLATPYEDEDWED